MPDTTDDEQLAEEFTEFFMGRNQEICKALDSHPTYEPMTSQGTAKYKHSER